MLEKVENYVDGSVIMRVLQKVFTYFSPITLIFLTLITMWIINYNKKRARLVKLIEKIPGPPALPFIGEFFKKISKCDIQFHPSTIYRKRNRNQCRTRW